RDPAVALRRVAAGHAAGISARPPRRPGHLGRDHPSGRPDPHRGGRMRRAALRWWQPATGLLAFAVVVWFTGRGPLLDGLNAVDARVLVIGALLAVPVTVAC